MPMSVIETSMPAFSRICLCQPGRFASRILFEISRYVD